MSKLSGKHHSRYFEGWYLKQQNRKETVALIPAFHANEKGEASASLQVIHDQQSYNIPFPADSLYISRKSFFVRLGECVFSSTGCRLNVKSKECDLQGSLRFGPLTPPSYDIMGPFCRVPFMECRHTVVSLFHSVDGNITINGRSFPFENGYGYIEGDRGVSFPKCYAWTQCSWKNGSIMLSIADIPFGAFSFIGCIGFLFLNGKEYRIATYLGAKLIHVSENCILIKQGKMVLEIQLLKENSQPLYAPHKGSMVRTIRESASCTVRYKCMNNDRILFDFESEQASFENNWRS